MKISVKTSELRREKGGRAIPRPPFDCIALLLQGGGSLGAYQGGVYQALAEAGLHPDWVAGISIGAINAAIIAGNPPEKRVERLRAFWERITGSPLGRWVDPFFIDGMWQAGVGDMAHGLLDQFSAFQALIAGAPGFFKPRFPPPWLSPPGRPESTSFYDTAALAATLERLVDFDRINGKADALQRRRRQCADRQFRLFRHRDPYDRLRAHHGERRVAARISGDRDRRRILLGRRTRLQHAAAMGRRLSSRIATCWPSRSICGVRAGEFPRDMSEVAVRQKEIQFSSRTRASTDRLRRMQKIRSALAVFCAAAARDCRKTAEEKFLTEFADLKVYNIVQLIYRSKHYEGNSKDYEFSRLSMADHWRAGYRDAVQALRHKEIFERPDNEEGFRAFDFEDGARADRKSIRQKEKEEVRS